MNYKHYRIYNFCSSWCRSLSDFGMRGMPSCSFSIFACIFIASFLLLWWHKKMPLCLYAFLTIQKSILFQNACLFCMCFQNPDFCISKDNTRWLTAAGLNSVKVFESCWYINQEPLDTLKLKCSVVIYLKKKSSKDICMTTVPYK